MPHPATSSLSASCSTLLERLDDPTYRRVFFRGLLAVRGEALHLLRYPHLAEEDAIAAGNRYLAAQGMIRAWRLGRNAHEKPLCLRRFIETGLLETFRTLPPCFPPPDTYFLTAPKEPSRLELEQVAKAAYRDLRGALKHPDLDAHRRFSYDPLPPPPGFERFRIHAENPSEEPTPASPALALFPGDGDKGVMPSPRLTRRALLRAASGAAAGSALGTLGDAPSSPGVLNMASVTGGAALGALSVAMGDIATSRATADRTRQEEEARTLETVFSATAAYCRALAEKSPAAGR